jgi:hypothetical protein
MAGARARRAPQRGAQLAVAEQASSSARERRVADLAGEVLEEAVELVEVAVGDRQERAGSASPAAAVAIRAQVDPGARPRGKRSTRPATRTRVAPLEAPGRGRSASRNTRAGSAPGAVAQLDREVRAHRRGDSSRSLRVQAKTPAISSPARSVLIATGVTHP